ncbi:MAG: hypothetical protein OXR67_10720 [Chloroflexota bacterium]|nr:hypothetical protein [Chloroflexota bacterium]
MQGHIGTLGFFTRRRHWLAALAVTLLLMLALACSPQPAAAPQVVEVDSGAAAAAAQAVTAAEQALAAAQQAQAAADNTEATQAAAQALAAAEQALAAAQQAQAAAETQAGSAEEVAAQARTAAEQALAAAEMAQAAAEAPRQGENRPTITVIGSGGGGTASVSGTGTGTGTGSVSGIGTGTGTGSPSGTGTGTGSASGTGTGTGSVSGAIAMMEKGAAGGLMIPTNLSYETSGPTKSDGYYTPTTNREIYQKISTDYQEILKLTNVIKEGKPLPAAEIWLLYEAGPHTRLGPQSRTLRSFATGSTPSTYYPESAEFYGSDTFLDDPIENAVRGRGEAAEYTDAQKRQAIGKGLLRIVYHWAKFYMIIGQDRMSSRLIDEAWAVYVGEEVNGDYPNSLSAVARSREGNFGREGTIDIPLRQAMDRARQAADAQNAEALEVATNEVYSRFNAIFYLATVRYMGRVFDDVQAGNRDALGTHQVEALAFYQSIQPDVAKANASADETIMAYLTAEPSHVTAASRNRALDALNGTASALMLESSDLVTEYTDDTGDGSSGAPSPDTGDLDLSSSVFIPVNLPHETDRSVPSPSDGYYHATTNREHYQKIPSDYQEIVKLTNVIKEGRPLPVADIFLLYEVGMHTRIGVRSKTLRGFARDPERAEEFPLATEFYGSGSFLDSAINNVVRGRGAAENWTDAQKRQAINKGILRILYHWSKHYVIGGCADLDSGDVDEGWGIYVGLPGSDADYPYSLSALARSREGNFGREGTIDIPLRQAFERVRQAAENGDAAACDAAAQEVYSRYNAIFYLATVRYIGVSYNDVAEGKDPGTHLVEALAFYQSIQPEVAQASPDADATIIAFLESAPDQITAQSRDAALAALNSVADALLLNDSDLVTGY